LQPYAVSWSGGDVKDFKWEGPPPKDIKGKPGAGPSGTLAIAFNEPIQGRIQALRVRCLLARSPGGAWTSPALRVRNAVSRGETVEVRLHPRLPVGKWDPGTFQQTNLVTEADGAQRVTLAETAADASASRRPTLLPPLKDLDLHTSESYLWQIAQRGPTLAAEIRYAAARGQLFELRLKAPKAASGYEIESVAMQPAEMLGGWHPDKDALVIDLKQPLTRAKKAVLQIQVRADPRELAPA